MDRARQSRLGIQNKRTTRNRRVASRAAPQPKPRGPVAKVTKERRGVKTGGDRHELLAILFLTAAAITGLALFSFDSEGDNWIGSAGAAVAGTLFETFGLGAFVLPLAFFFAFLGLVLPDGKRPGLVPTFAYLGLIFGASMLVDLLLPSLRPYGARPGGSLGGTAADLSSATFSRAGSVILLLGCMAAAWVVATGFRVSKVALWLGATGRSVGAWLADFVRAQVEQHRAERQAMEEERAREAEAAAEASEEDLLAQAAFDAAIPKRRKVKAEPGTLEADLDGRLPLEEEKPKARPAVVAAPKASPVAKAPPSIPPAAESSPTPAVAPELPPDPAWVGGLELTTHEPEPLPRIEAKPAAAVEAPPVAEAQEEPVTRLPPAPPPTPAEEAEAPVGKRAAVVPVIELPKAPKPKRSDSPFDLITTENGFSLPPVSLLDGSGDQERDPIDEGLLHGTAERLRQKLADFGIQGEVERIRPGPVVTMYEFAPAPGVKISRIAGLSDDLAMALEALRVRIVAPIPGRGVVGIEVPNAKRETVYFRDIIEQEAFRKSKSKLTMAVGKDIEGMPFVADLARMPHLLISGTTGSGKSVSVNSMIMSLLFKATPEEVRLIMVDPKMLELSIYEGIPHLLLPVVTDPRKAALALRWAVDEMERRYAMMAELGVRDLAGFNRLVDEKLSEQAKAQLPPSEDSLPVGETKTVRVFDLETGESGEELLEHAPAREAAAFAPTPAAAAAAAAEEGPKPQKLPYLVIIIDELADLMMVASKEVETYIARIAQKARAAGIHLMVATQRPSVDVVTGLIKANLPSRISFLLRSNTDSRTILDSPGAEKLLGQGDMLILPPTSHHLQRVHGALVTEKEIKKVVDHLKSQGSPVYDESILKAPEEEGEDGGGEDDLSDELYDQALAIVAEMKSVSISMLQRRMRIGYNRSARMIERMERDGVVGPADGAKPREVLIHSPN